MDWKAFFYAIFQSQILGVLLGFTASYFIHLDTKKENKLLQKYIWKKEFDKNQIEKIIEIFRSILILLKNNETEKIRAISQEQLIKLKTEVQLNVSFDTKIKEKIISSIYEECLYYNEIGIVKYSETLSQTEVSEIEKKKRLMIEKNIADVIDEIKSIYSDF